MFCVWGNLTAVIADVLLGTVHPLDELHEAGLEVLERDQRGFGHEAPHQVLRLFAAQLEAAEILKKSIY